MNNESETIISLFKKIIDEKKQKLEIFEFIIDLLDTYNDDYLIRSNIIQRNVVSYTRNKNYNIQEIMSKKNLLLFLEKNDFIVQEKPRNIIYIKKTRKFNKDKIKELLHMFY